MKGERPNQRDGLELIIDASLNNISFVLTDNKDIYYFCHEKGMRLQSTLLLPYIAKAFEHDQLKGKALHDVRHVIFCRGPGSFTALRIVWSVLQGLFWQSETKLWVGSSLELRCLSLRQRGDESVLVFMPMGRGRFAYGSLVGADFAQNCVTESAGVALLEQLHPDVVAGTKMTDAFHQAVLKHKSKNSDFRFLTEDIITAEGLINMTSQACLTPVMDWQTHLDYMLEPDIG